MNQMVNTGCQDYYSLLLILRESSLPATGYESLDHVSGGQVWIHDVKSPRDDILTKKEVYSFAMNPCPVLSPVPFFLFVC
jgi:hypothetical protein